MIANSLQNILDFKGDVESTFVCSFALSYTDVFGAVLTYELVEGGKDIPVTNANRQVTTKNYINLFISLRYFWGFFSPYQKQPNRNIVSSDINVLGRPASNKIKKKFWKL